MDEERQTEQPSQMATDEIEVLIALVEARVIENLTRIIERLAQESGERSA
ncbi:MAG: hypothetical protein LC121_26335 [Anaerolineae bacterium]|nr:hypothetical protein [Anaerolineae bacterium]